MKSEIEKPEKKRFLIYLAGLIPAWGSYYPVIHHALFRYSCYLVLL